LKEGVLKEKELEEARAVFAKHGFAVPEHIAKNSKSRTSSEMLFGDSNADNSKKRETKAVDRDDRMSVVSGRTSKSNRSIKKESVVIDEAKWKKLDEKAKSGHCLYKCLR
jgi:hypothetical protein